MTPEKRAVDVVEEIADAIAKYYGDGQSFWLLEAELVAKRLKNMGLLKEPGDSVEGMLKELGPGARYREALIELRHYGSEHTGEDVKAMQRIAVSALLALPTDGTALRERDAAKWDEGHKVGWGDCEHLISSDTIKLTPNPHRTPEKK